MNKRSIIGLFVRATYDGGEYCGRIEDIRGGIVLLRTWNIHHNEKSFDAVMEDHLLAALPTVAILGAALVEDLSAFFNYPNIRLMMAETGWTNPSDEEVVAFRKGNEAAIMRYEMIFKNHGPGQ